MSISNEEQLAFPMDDDVNVFIEQAEYIDEKEFLKWSIEHPDEKKIIKKLSSGGAKLLVGPRGCGKTTIMLKTYYGSLSTLDSTELKDSFPIYVNFKSALRVEPMYKANVNANFWFNQWLLYKVYQGLYKTAEDVENYDAVKYKGKLKELESTLTYSKAYVNKYLSNIEHRFSELSSEESILSTSILEEEISKALNVFNKQHCVLLLDDAAHAFSPEQQKDFFEFFRNVKSKRISPKAAIYPGVTTYSANFHVGHDAEEINVWLSVETVGYVEFMYTLLSKRLPTDIYQSLIKKKEIMEVIAYASFGLPRSFLNMVRELYKNDNGIVEYKLNKRDMMSAIKKNVKQTVGIYQSLQYQLPTYSKFITKGEEIFRYLVNSLKEYNKGKDADKQTVVVGISKDAPVEVKRVISFYQYAGLVKPVSEISKGVQEGIYELFSIHYGMLIENNAFIAKKSISMEELRVALKIRNTQYYKKVSATSLLNGQDPQVVFPLSLPPCQQCKTPRLNENAKFCHECGSMLKSSSIFEALIANDIDKLPLTPNRVKNIKEQSSIRTIRDILMDIDNTELRKVKQIGEVWAEKIFSYAEEFIV
ncbi:ORC-CDC6 family AAA ATPase [Ectobacillus ponti]|uniref:Zinc ribbon domain-containing protein n=1 Tax=Ectobacillus ponti TaxID=2961894 RepID=A0AA41X9F1_9BACI|nr:hypothetical protein [Ectobacillus ponti]MCP8971339.1 hypothetical protein [Ectobacillus ponti]